MSYGEATPRAVTLATDEEVLPDLEPWHEVGWIFGDDVCTAVERHDDEALED